MHNARALMWGIIFVWFSGTTLALVLSPWVIYKAKLQEKIPGSSFSHVRIGSFPQFYITVYWISLCFWTFVCRKQAILRLLFFFKGPFTDLNKSLSKTRKVIGSCDPWLTFLNSPLSLLSVALLSHTHTHTDTLYKCNLPLSCHAMLLQSVLKFKFLYTISLLNSLHS